MNQKVYNFFKEISSIPRGTYNIDEISNYLVGFAKKNNLEVYQDDVKNVIIKKDASKGYEDKEPVILQAHMDMVCQKDKLSNHDFYKDSIDIYEEDGFLKANKTTLGADDGIGMAMILSVLDSDLKHPKIEAIFTVDEEVGMEGAINIDFSNIDSNRLINIDSEEEGILTAGCAGGSRVNVTYNGNIIDNEGYIYTLEISNLMGGHSGTDIDKKRVNAIKCLIDYIYDIDNINIISIDGGLVDNAICDNCKCKFLLKDKIDDNNLKNKIDGYLEENMELKRIVSIEYEYGKHKTFDNKSSKEIINYIKEVPNGIISYEKNLDNVVRTSLNYGIIKTTDNVITSSHLIRSSSNSEKDKVINNIFDIANRVNAETIIANSYSAWEYNPNSELRGKMEEIYEDMYNKKLEIQVIHAGLECGILIEKKKALDCVSIGPNIFDVHTPSERLDIESTNRVYEYLVKVLENI